MPAPLEFLPLKAMSMYQYDLSFGAWNELLKRKFCCFRADSNLRKQADLKIGKVTSPGRKIDFVHLEETEMPNGDLYCTESEDS